MGRHIENDKASEWEQAPSPVATPNFVAYWTPKTCGPETPSEYGTPMGSDTPRVVTTNLYSPLYYPGTCGLETPSEYATPKGGDTPCAMGDFCSPRPSFPQLGGTQNVRRCSSNTNTYPLHSPCEDIHMEVVESSQPKAVPALDLVNRGQSENYLATDPLPSQSISPYPDNATHATFTDLLEISSAMDVSSGVPKMSPPDPKSLTQHFPRNLRKMKEEALRLASSQGDVMEVHLLVEQGTDISAACGNGWTPLHKVAFKGHEPVVQLLLEKGADISTRDSHSNTPLHWAASGGHEKVVQLLLENGAGVSARDSNSNTPLHLAADGGHEKAIRLLLEKGADVSAKNSSSNTPLHWAAGGGHRKVVQLLLEKGANVSAGWSNSNTPLDWAVLRRHGKVVRLLLDNGSDSRRNSRWI